MHLQFAASFVIRAAADAGKGEQNRALPSVL